MNYLSGFNRFLPRRAMARGVAVLAGSNALAQMLALAASPLLTRLYTPADFGVLAVFISLTTIGSAVVCLRYEVTISLPESDRDAFAAAIVALGFCILMSAACLMVVLYFREQIADLLEIQQYSDYLLFLPLSLLLLGLFNVTRNWAIRTRAFGQIAIARLRQVLASLAIQIVAFPYAALALLMAQVASQGTGCLSLARRTFTRERLQNVQRDHLVETLIRYRRFPLLSLWATLINRSGVQVPTLVLVTMFGPVEAGFYALANRVLQAPSTVIGNAVSGVFFRTAADAARSGKLADLTLKTFSKLSEISLPPLFLLGLLAPDIFGYLFGETWREAGNYAQWMCIVIYFAMVCVPLMLLFLVLGKQTHELIYQVGSQGARALMMIAGASTGSVMIAIAFYALTTSVSQIGLLIWVAIQTGCGVVPMLKATARSLLWALVLCSPVQVFSGQDMGGSTYLLLAALASVLVTLRVLYIVREAYQA